MVIGSVGEGRLFELITGWVRAQGRPRALIRGIGDDGATVRTTSRTLITTDAFVANVHFRPGWGRPWQFGWKALAANVSDVAAGGGVPLAAVVSLALPTDLPVKWLEEFYAGMIACSRTYAMAIAGGNITRASEFSSHITLIGRAPLRMIGRSGAQPGDLLAVTGSLGGSAAGLAALRRGWLDAPAKEAIFRHLVPRPRVAAGKALGQFASAQVDISDGLVRDAGHLSAASGVRIAIVPGGIPIHPAAAPLAGRLRMRSAELALGSGEEYELLATIPRRQWKAAFRAVSRAGIPLTVIGECRRGRGVEIVGGLRVAGYDHFSVARRA